MVQAVARIIATTQGRTPARKALTPAYFIRLCSAAAMSRMMTKEGSTTPTVAAKEPASPACEAPIKVAMFTASGPGVDSDNAIKLKNSLSVNHTWYNTTSRTSENHKETPPPQVEETLRRARKAFNLPLALGFGLQHPEQLAAIPADIRPDAAVFGSALLNHLVIGNTAKAFLEVWTR